MKKAIVLGASGGMGYALVHELVNRGIETRAFARNQNKLNSLFKDVSVDIVTGNAYDADDLKRVCSDVDVIFHTISVPYPEWQMGHPTLMKNVLAAARNGGAKVIVIDNIYAYGRSNGQKVSEDANKNPHTKKGKIRLSIDQMAKDAHLNGVPTMTLHFPDFYGPNAENTILNETLKSVAINKKAIFVGPKHIKREFIFTPDGAKAAVELALNEKAYGQNWNIPADDVITGNEIIEILQQLTGYNKKVSTVTKKMVKMLGIFSADMKEIAEMMYLTEEPVVLSGIKYEQQIGPIPKTSYRDGLSKTIEYMMKNRVS